MWTHQQGLPNIFAQNFLKIPKNSWRFEVQYHENLWVRTWSSPVMSLLMEKSQIGIGLLPSLATAFSQCPVTTWQATCSSTHTMASCWSSLGICHGTGSCKFFGLGCVNQDESRSKAGLFIWCYPSASSKLAGCAIPFSLHCRLVWELIGWVPGKHGIPCCFLCLRVWSK